MRGSGGGEDGLRVLVRAGCAPRGRRVSDGLRDVSLKNPIFAGA